MPGLDGRRAECSSTLLFHTAAENNVLSFVFPVTVLETYSLKIRVFWSFKESFQKRRRSW